MSSELDSPFLRSIGLMLTYKCTTSCPHCMVEAGPNRRKEMHLDEALDWIRQAGLYRDGHILSIGLTGGEPFYDLRRLEVISEYAKRFGFYVTVVTNAYWASTKARALEVLQRLKAIPMISLSTDAYHQNSIPLEYIKNAAWSARECGRVYDIAVCTDSEKDPIAKGIVDDLRASGEGERLKVTVTTPVGRAARFSNHLNRAVEREPSPGGCMLANTPLVFPNGKVIACIGALVALPPTHPMFLGDLRQESLRTILDRAELNPFVHAERLWGPYRLAVLLREYGFGELLPKEFVKDCPCDGCYKLFSDRRIIRALESILHDRQMTELIAYGRAYYHNDMTMAQHLGLFRNTTGRATSQ